MLDLDRLVDLRWSLDAGSPRSKKALDANIRQNDKILVEATNQSVELITQRNRLGSNFEALFRSLGLGAGVVFGGPIGAAIMSSVAGGIGRGVGEYMSNRIYGQAINQLEQITTNHKYKQLVNFAVRSDIKASIDLNDEFYKQANEEIGKTIQDISQ